MAQEGEAVDGAWPGREVVKVEEEMKVPVGEGNTAIGNQTDEERRKVDAAGREAVWVEEEMQVLMGKTNERSHDDWEKKKMEREK